MAKEIRVVELFAGVGGFRCGLEASSDHFVTLWANQWEPGRKNQFAFDCYDAHYGDSGSLNVNEDIANARDEVPEHDLLVGGFPCQDYSVATTQAKGIAGKKGVLWWHIDHIIKRRHPKYVLLENVDRLLRSPSTQRGRDFGIILRCLADLGYSVEWRAINAADYGFVQKRRRVFIFASRGDTRKSIDIDMGNPEATVHDNGFFSKEFPIDPVSSDDKIGTFNIGSEKYSSLVEVSDHFAEQFLSAGVMKDHQIYTRGVTPRFNGKRARLRDILEDDVDERFYVKALDLPKWEFMKGPKKLKRKKAGTNITYLYSEGGIPFPDNLDGPGRTMLTSEGTKNRSSHIISGKDGRYRILTPVECERMNGFPDDWTNTMTERQRYFVMGNALVVGLIKKMGDSLLRLTESE
ncbi:MAG: DNA (cytosine-5-)-methyltransferase [Candidatus Methanomethylophilaceae archaeon]|jgi:DNA (cytosine-5)-methyltransferase 1|nr:DNA (cytosine-5-)-methyltransferase [Candidatus Methanomethylophilaceae archaeon]